MKKQLSLILTIILILSLTPVALADNTDTISNWDIRISVPEGKTAVLKGSEYYIYGQHEGSIPYVMLRVYRYDNAEKFITDFTEYMRQQYSDLRVISAAEQKTIGNKRCWEIDFGYTVSGYEVKDRRVIITTGETTYMFASKEIESNGMLIGSMLDDVVADCELLGPDTDSVLVDSDFMLVTGLSGMRKALNNGATIESVYYTDGYGFSVSEFTTTDPDEMKALWNVLTRIQLGAPTNMSITDWYPLIVFNLDDGTRYGARFEGHCLTIRRDNFELEHADEFWTLTGTLVQKYTQGNRHDYLEDYAPVLNSYLSFLSGTEPTEMNTTERGDYYFVLGETGISEMSRNGGQLGFWLHDMDGNGIPELLIGAIGADYYDQSLIYDMFTLKEGTPVRILVSSARIRYYLCEDDLILHEGSGGAPYNFSILCYLKNNRLELATGIVMADSECFEVHEDRESFFTERKPSDRSITREEYSNKMEKMETATVPMELMLF